MSLREETVLVQGHWKPERVKLFTKPPTQPKSKGVRVENKTRLKGHKCPNNLERYGSSLR